MELSGTTPKLSLCTPETQTNQVADCPSRRDDVVDAAEATHAIGLKTSLRGSLVGPHHKILATKRCACTPKLKSCQKFNCLQRNPYRLIVEGWSVQCGKGLAHFGSSYLPHPLNQIEIKSNPYHSLSPLCTPPRFPALQGLHKTVGHPA